MTAKRSFGDELTSVIDSLLHAIGCILAVTRDIGPDVKNIGLS